MSLAGRRASAHIPQSTSGRDIVTAICAALDGDVWLPRALVGDSTELKLDEATPVAWIATLTSQQFRVMATIAEGLLNKQLAREPGVSEATVKAHMTAIRRKVGVSIRTRIALASQLASDQQALPPMPPDED